MDRARRVDTREAIARQRLQTFSWVRHAAPRPLCDPPLASPALAPASLNPHPNPNQDVACEYPTPDRPGADLTLLMKAMSPRDEEEDGEEDEEDEEDEGEEDEDEKDE